MYLRKESKCCTEKLPHWEGQRAPLLTGSHHIVQEKTSMAATYGNVFGFQVASKTPFWLTRCLWDHPDCQPAFIAILGAGHHSILLLLLPKDFALWWSKRTIQMEPNKQWPSCFSPIFLHKNLRVKEILGITWPTSHPRSCLSPASPRKGHPVLLRKTPLCRHNLTPWQPNLVFLQLWFKNWIQPRTCLCLVLKKKHPFARSVLRLSQDLSTICSRALLFASIIIEKVIRRCYFLMGDRIARGNRMHFGGQSHLSVKVFSGILNNVALSKALDHSVPWFPHL